MIESLTPESIAAEIKLLREDAGYKGAILIVEGETDANFFSNFLTNNDILIRWLNGKPKSIKLTQLLEQGKCQGFVAIVDADFWHIDEIPSLGPSIFTTDVHDLDMMIFSSPAFNKVMREFLPAKTLERLEKKFGDLRNALLESVRLLGHLRWINEKQSLGIGFRKPDNQRNNMYWVDLLIVDDLRFDLDPILVSLCGSNRPLQEHLKHHLTHDDISRYDSLMLCNGHDVMHVTCKLIKNNGRSIVREKTDSNDVERSFRLAYEMGFFRQTNLYMNLVHWQNSTGYKLLD